MKKIKIAIFVVALTLFCSLSFLACQADVKITFEKNGGEGGTSVAYFVKGSLLPTATAPTKEGYAFGGYYDAEGVWFYDEYMNPKRTWSGGDVTVYAKWDVGEYRVTLDMQGGKDGTDYVMANTGEYLPLANAPKRAGFVFDGYYDAPSTQEEAQGKQYYDADMMCVNVWDKGAAATLYAKWIALGFQLTLNAGAGAGGTTVSVKVDSPMPAANKPTRSGYTFVGYFSLQNGEGSKYYNSDMSSAANWSTPQDSTIYAYWVPFTAGAGTAANPFLLSTKENLKSFSTDPSSFTNLYLKLDADVDMGNETWTPISSGTVSGFLGEFDGGGHTISNFRISGSATYVGLFSRSEGIIKNLTISSFSITSSATRVYVGGIVASTNADLINCSAINGTITSSSLIESYVGMLVGKSSGADVINCSASNTSTSNHITTTGYTSISIETGNNYMGGLIGYKYGGATTDCFAKINVRVTTSNDPAAPQRPYAGGLIGRNSADLGKLAPVTRCYATGNVSLSSADAAGSGGGLIGTNESPESKSCEIKDCYATGNVTLSTAGSGWAFETRGGGLMGYDDNGRINNCYATGNVTISDNYFSTIFAGGLIGRSHNSVLRYCFATGNVQANYTDSMTYYSGLTAYADDNMATVTYCYVYDVQTVTQSKIGSLTTEHSPVKINIGTACTADNLSTLAFYTDTLKWESSVWDFSDLSFLSRKLPTLK